MNKLIILDRDGVINEDSDHYVRSAEQWIPIEGSIEAIAMLSHAGYTVVIATNQSGLARGYFDEQALMAMHNKMQRLVLEKGGRINGIYFCPHDPDDHCTCRKPNNGMIEQILQDYHASPEQTWVIGDSLRDLQAGVKSHCNIALVLTGKGNKTKQQLRDLHDTFSPTIYDNLKQFVSDLLTEREK